jgi:diguanylate cyclase (GGDEF)-like protein/PAS domain S-box-containing protein
MIPTSSVTQRKHILVIEDDPGIAALETELIEDHGFEVVHAADGRSGLAALAQRVPDLMLLDYSLPDMTGIELLERQQAEGRRLPPFIVTTGAGDEYVAVDLMRRGAENYLIKDHQFLANLPNAIDRAMRSIEMEQRLAAAEKKLKLAARVLEGTAEAVMVTDEQHVIIDVNPAFEIITGRSKADVLGHTPLILLPGHARDAEVDAQIRELLATAGRWQGEITLRRNTGEVFTAWFNISRLDGEADDASHFVSLFSDISSVKIMAEHLDYLAHHDPLTNLPNRLLFIARLNHGIARADREKRGIGLLFLDLDHFKEVNDRFGHAAGDDLLRVLAKQMGTLLREEDTLARLGGDEFVMLIEGATTEDDLRRIVEQVLALFPHPVATAEGVVNVTVSIGGALYPTDATTSDWLLACADQAMYEAKEAGRNTFVLFDRTVQPAMGQAEVLTPGN